MRRIKDNLADHTGLIINNTEGDALLRLRPTPGKKRHWDALIRLTPRPLATRDWRICNLPGALNGTVAHAMVRLSQPHPDDTVINLTCGSATLLIERIHRMRARYLAGVDTNTNALQCAAENITGTGSPQNIQLIQSDATQTPFADRTADVLLADLPFGQLTGSHDENIWMYPALMSEAARIAKSGARFILITHEVNLMNSVLEQLSNLWHCHEERMINLSGLHPRIFVLERL
jgi:23S rRNA G2445 N2-methylase RlmL